MGWRIDFIYMACSCVIKDNFFSSVEKNEKQLKKMRKIDAYLLGFICGSAIKHLPAMQELLEVRVQSLGWENSLEEKIATQFSILA